MSELDPVETPRPFFTAARPEPFADDLYEPPAADPDRPAAGLREGPPPGFRMRHDAHYVDRLTAKSPDTHVRMVEIKEIDRRDGAAPDPPTDLIASIQRFGILQPLFVRPRNGRYELIAGDKRLAAAAVAGLNEVPCLLHQVDDSLAHGLAEADNLRARPASGSPADLRVRTTASVVTRELAQSLATVSSCLELVPDQSRPLRERLALDLARAELHRASWLLDTQDILKGDPFVARRDVRAGALVEKVAAALGPERRLSDVQLVLEIADASLTVSAV